MIQFMPVSTSLRITQIALLIKIFSQYSVLKCWREDASGIADPNTIILCKDLAEKLYSNVDCLGEILTIEDEVYSIIGIIDDPSGNSTIQFDFLVPVTNFFRTLPETYN